MGDFDGDGDDDGAVWQDDPVDGWTLVVDLSDTLTTDPAQLIEVPFTATPLGAGDRIFAGPYNGGYGGDPLVTPIIWRAASQTFEIYDCYVEFGFCSDVAVATVTLGVAGDVPIVGDLNENGSVDFAVLRPTGPDANKVFVNLWEWNDTINEGYGSPQDTDLIVDYGTAITSLGFEPWDLAGFVRGLSASGDTNSSRDVYLHDLSTGMTERLSVGPGSTELANGGEAPAISGDGRFVAFNSTSPEITVGSGFGEVLVRDLDTGVTTQVSFADDGSVPDGGSGEIGFDYNRLGVSNGGKRVAFQSFASNLVSPPTSEFADNLFLRNRDIDEDGVLDEPGGEGTSQLNLDTAGSPGNGWNNNRPSIAADGSAVSFKTSVPLAAGDTNDSEDVYVRDVDRGVTERISLDSYGQQLPSGGVGSSVSDDGRYVAFWSRSFGEGLGEGLVGGDVHVRDRLTGITRLVNVPNAGGAADGISRDPAINSDGQIVAFTSSATNLVAGDGNALPDVFVSGPDPADAGTQDRTGDLDVYDTVLEVLDLSDLTVDRICPSGPVSISGDAVAFLRPESAGDSIGCPALDPSGSLNADSDADDLVLHFYDAGSEAISNVGLAAEEVQVTTDYIASLTSESGDGVDRNGDGDQFDLTPAIAPIVGGVPAAPVFLSSAATSIDALRTAEIVGGQSRTVVAFLTPESGDGNIDHNGDGDTEDSVLSVYIAEESLRIDLAISAEEFVLGERLLAFRVSEAAEGQNLNPGTDADQDDDVLHVYDLVTRALFNTGQSVVPCRLEACDPRVPYRVEGDVVTFLTLESQQGNTDLSGDGVADDLVVQTFNVRAQIADGLLEARDTVGVLRAGLCTDTQATCDGDIDCPAGRCIVPPGLCVRQTSRVCDPGAPQNSCGNPNRFCVPDSNDPFTGTCYRKSNACTRDTDCRQDRSFFCIDGDENLTSLVSPTVEGPAGQSSFVTAGQCIEPLAAACLGQGDCQNGEQCGPTGFCERKRGTCETDADCLGAAVCRDELITANAADIDDDAVADPYANCPYDANADQLDTDSDGAGDACDLTPLPEPGMVPLLIAGLAALGLLARCRTRERVLG